MQESGSFSLYGLMLGALFWGGLAAAGRAQEGPYFVTYDSHLEEPGNLEVEFEPLAGKPWSGDQFLSYLTEFEYGTTAWWTTELYLDSQTTAGQSTIFTGFRVENRFQVLAGQHRVNPVLYVEYEDTSGADKSLKEVVGFDSQDDGAVPNDIARRDIQHEIETKLILSSDFKGWNVSENFIAEKNLAHEPWEFGYAWGVNRPIRLPASPFECNLCGENWRAGVELYGGLGTVDRFTLHETSQYIAPIVSWELPNGTRFRISPTFGLTDNAYRFLLRVGVSYEFPSLGRRVKQFFRGGDR